MQLNCNNKQQGNMVDIFVFELFPCYCFLKFLLACDNMDNIYKMNTTSISPAADFVVLVDVAPASDWPDGSVEHALSLLAPSVPVRFLSHHAAS